MHRLWTYLCKQLNVTHIPFGGQYHDKTERLATGCAGLLLSEGREPNNYASFYNVQTESHILFASTLFSVYTGTMANVIWVLVLLRNTSVLFSPSCRGYSVHIFVCIPACSLKHAVAAMRKYFTIVRCVLSVLSSHLWCPEKPARTNGCHTLRMRWECRLAILLSRHRASARGTTSNDGKRLPACW